MVNLPNRKEILVGFAVGDDRDLRFAGGVTPPPQQFAFLDIPAQDLLAGADDGSAGASATCSTGQVIVSGPDRIRRSRCDEPERIRVLEFSAIDRLENF